jgi:hypothetical protein
VRSSLVLQNALDENAPVGDQIDFGGIVFEHVFRHLTDVIRLDLPLKALLVAVDVQAGSSEIARATAKKDWGNKGHFRSHPLGAA